MSKWKSDDHPRNVVGKFADKHRDEPGVLQAIDEAAHDPEVPAQIRHQAQRTMDLLSGEDVEATTYTAVGNPENTDLREQWWDTVRVAAEYDSQGRRYPQMPDDYTPSMTGGQALSGHRRTHRMSYQGNGMTLRMPSATSIRRFATDEQGASTFDVPITAVFNRPDGTQGSVTGMIRVTRFGDHQWSTTPLGFPPGADSEAYAEAVCAVLESRRVSRGLAQAGDLVERRRERLASAGAPMAPVKSSWIQAMGYTPDGVMLTQAKAGKTYGHKVPREVYEAISKSPGPGAAYNAFRKQGAMMSPAVVETCGTCMNVYSVARGHSCSGVKPPTGKRWAHNLTARAEAGRRLAEAVESRLRR